MLPNDLNKLILPITRSDKLKSFQHVIFLLVGASLKLAHLGRGNYGLLESQKHAKVIRDLQSETDINDYRPDIVYQCVRGIQNSLLNRVGMVSLFIRTQENVMIFVSPKWRCPDTYDEFASVIGCLLVKRQIICVKTGETLLRLVKNDVDELFSGFRKIAFEVGHEETTIKRLISESQLSTDYLQQDNLLDKYSNVYSMLYRIQKNRQLSPVFIIGAMAKGDVSDFSEDLLIERTVSLSGNGLTAHCVCENLLFEFESLWINKHLS